MEHLIQFNVGSETYVYHSNCDYDTLTSAIETINKNISIFLNEPFNLIHLCDNTPWLKVEEYNKIMAYGIDISNSLRNKIANETKAGNIFFTLETFRDFIIETILALDEAITLEPYGLKPRSIGIFGKAWL